MANKEINIIIKAVDEATKTLKGIGDWLSWFAEKNKATFTKMAVGGTVAFGAITASVLSASTALWQNADRLLDLQAITSVSTKKLQEYQHIQRAAWVSTEAMAKAATQLSKKFFDLQDEWKAAGYTMSKLGVQVRNTDSSIRDTGDILEDTIKALSWVENEMERNNMAFYVFGKSYEDLIPIMSLGEEWFNQLQQEANELWLVMWEDALNSANEFRIAQETLTATTEGLKNSLATAMIPILQTMLDALQPIITSLLNWMGQNQELVWWIVTIVWSLAWLVALFGTLWLLIPTIVAWFTLLTWPIGLAVIAITALATAWGSNFMWIRDMTAWITTQITEIFGLFFENLMLFWNTHGESVMLVVTTLFEWLVFTIQTSLEYLSVVFQTFFDLVNVIINLFSWNWAKAWEWIKSIVVTNATFIWNTLKSIFGETRTSITSWLQVMYDFILDKFEKLLGFITGTVDKLRGAWNSAVSFFGGGGWSPTGARALGWPVQGWKSYLVGERWPEMFTPATSWSITPNSQMWWGGTSININMWWVTVTNEADEQRLAQTIIQEITRQTQLFNLWIN